MVCEVATGARVYSKYVHKALKRFHTPFEVGHRQITPRVSPQKSRNIVNVSESLKELISGSSFPDVAVSGAASDIGSRRRDGTPRPPARRDDQGCDVLALLIVLKSEMVRICILVGICANVANAIADDTPRVLPRGLVTYFPREAAALILATSRFSRFFCTSPVCAVLEAFDAALAHAKNETFKFASDGFAVLDNTAESCSGLAQAWRTASITGLAAIRALDKAIAAYEITGFDEESSALAELLKGAIAGSYTLIGDSGAVAMPNWAERRDSTRVLLNCSATLVRAEQRFPIVLRDISTSGLGLEAETDFVPGDIVCVEVSNTLTLEGSVVWSAGTRTGIHFHRPMQSADPRLRFCSGPHKLTSLM